MGSAVTSVAVFPVFGAAALGYVAGMLPSAEIVAAGLDPRRAGSGNPGAANIASLLGKRAGAAVFGMDMGKAVVAAQVGRALAGGSGANVAACAAVLGHCFPANRGFRGGKGVAASFGQMLSTFPAYLPVDIALGVVAAKSDVWKARPVTTIGASCGLWTLLAAVWTKGAVPNAWAPPAGRSMPIAAAVSSAAIVYRFAAEANRTPPADPDEGSSGNR
jgi:acyl-phosphate glycerol 3-phosphate acyltransferase